MFSLVQGSIHTSSRCIQCLQAILLTEEHVFADGAGGVLTAHILCSTCNGHFGKNIDAPYLKQPVVELARNAYRIGGRRDVIPQPLGGPYKVDGPIGQSTIKLDIDFKPKIIPQVEDIEITEDGAIRTTMVIDAADREKIPAIVRSKFERFFRSDRGIAMGWTPQEQENAIKDTVDGYMSAPDKESPVGMLSSTITMDLGTLFLEVAKAAFELAAIEDGDTFVDSSGAEHFRQLFGQVERGRIESIPSFLDMLKNFQAAQLPADSQVFLGIQSLTGGKAYEHHVAILSGRHIIVSMFGDAYVFGNLRASEGHTAMYTNNAIDGKVYRLKM